MICRWCKHWNNRCGNVRVMTAEGIVDTGEPAFHPRDGTCTVLPEGVVVGDRKTQYCDACPWYRVDPVKMADSLTDNDDLADEHDWCAKANRERLGTYPWNEITDAERDYDKPPKKTKKARKAKP